MDLALGHWLPSNWAPMVLCSPSLLVLAVSFFALAGATLARVARFGLFGVCFILRVVIHEDLVA